MRTNFIRIVYRNTILIIISLSVLGFSQGIVEDGNEAGNTDSSISKEPLQIKKTSKSYLHKDIVSSRVLGVSGCLIHFTGTGLIFASQFTGDPIMNWIGFGLDIIGPIPSCAGASLIEDAMEEEYSTFPRHRYWGYYATSGVFFGFNAVVNVAELVAYSHGGFQYEATPIIFLVCSILTYITAEVYSGIATIGPLFYIRKAERRIQKDSAFTIRVLPNFTMDGGKGLCIVGTF